MLTLRRKSGQAVVIGDGPDAVTLIIDSIITHPDRSPQVSLSFDAPGHVPIDRAEIREAKERQRAEQVSRPPL